MSWAPRDICIFANNVECDIFNSSTEVSHHQVQLDEILSLLEGPNEGESIPEEGARVVFSMRRVYVQHFSLRGVALLLIMSDAVIVIAIKIFGTMTHRGDRRGRDIYPERDTDASALIM